MKLALIISIVVHVVALFFVGVMMNDRVLDNQEILIVLDGGTKDNDANLKSNFSKSGGAKEKKQTIARATLLADKSGADNAGNSTQNSQKSTASINHKLVLMGAAKSIEVSKQDPKDNYSSEDRTEGFIEEKQLASLMANFKQREGEFLEQKDVRFEGDFSTTMDKDAQYIAKIIAIIENTGKQYYPQEAISNNITGDVQVVLRIDSSGKISHYEIIKSGGKILDNGIGVIIRQAQKKFVPFDAKGRVSYEIEFVRTWRFERGFVVE